MAVMHLQAAKSESETLARSIFLGIFGTLKVLTIAVKTTATMYATAQTKPVPMQFTNII
jgi:hypothetical protein